MQELEKLGTFYLGRLLGPDGSPRIDAPLMLDARELTTHAVCVGMTGSGKTGLCLALLEEAAIDGIPAIVIDPKGDLGNLALTFPGLAAEDFLPWIDPGEATRTGKSAETLAAETANRWREGLAAWGQDAARIARFRQSADVAIYTPGSKAGLPLRVLASLDPPGDVVRADDEMRRDRVLAAVSGLLALLGIDADPLQSREHILVSTLLDRAWREQLGVDLPGLIAAIQAPPFERIGVVDIESFFPARDRFALAMRVNNLLASPGFGSWLEGEPLDIGRLLYTHDGRPRLSILSIAHLTDAERMFFVTLLLGEMLAWTRAQPGTSSLRALLYMDEVFGYFPPTANPPSKLPMLTLLKQARAFGVGVVLATQNPVDLDYKGLANTGTWFLGRLQTERDKARVIDGLEGASAAAGRNFDRTGVEATLSGLKSRNFLLNSVYADEPVLFQSRWALSYLRGPLTRAQIQTLMASRREATDAPKSPAMTPPASPRAECPAHAATTPLDAAPPALPPAVTQRFAPARVRTADLVYRPALCAPVKIAFVDRGAGVHHDTALSLLVEFADGGSTPVWDGAQRIEHTLELRTTGEPGARFATLPAEAMRPPSYARWSKEIHDLLYRSSELTLWRASALAALSRPGESEGEFRARLAQPARERRDAEIDRLRKRYAPRLTSLQDRIRRAEERVSRETTQYNQQKVQTAISLGSTILGALLGRKAVSVGTMGRAASTARGVGRAAREREEIARAEESQAALGEELSRLNAELQAEVSALEMAGDPARLELEPVALKPRKSDVRVEAVHLVWLPWTVGPDGQARPGWL